MFRNNICIVIAFPNQTKLKINEIKVIEIGFCLEIGTHNQIFIMYFTEMIDEHYKHSSSF